LKILTIGFFILKKFSIQQTSIWYFNEYSSEIFGRQFLDEYKSGSLTMLIRKIILLFLMNLSILVLPVAYAEANINNKININTADALTLENLQGIGPKRAASIIEFRDKNGMFESANDLKKINGIGQKTVDKNLDIIEVAFIPKEIIEDTDDSSDTEEVVEGSKDTEEVVEGSKDTEKVVEESKDTKEVVEPSKDTEESKDTEVKKTEEDK